MGIFAASRPGAQQLKAGDRLAGRRRPSLQTAVVDRDQLTRLPPNGMGGFAAHDRGLGR